VSKKKAVRMDEDIMVSQLKKYVMISQTKEKGKVKCGNG